MMLQELYKIGEEAAFAKREKFVVMRVQIRIFGLVLGVAWLMCQWNLWKIEWRIQLAAARNETVEVHRIQSAAVTVISPVPVLVLLMESRNKIRGMELAALMELRLASSSSILQMESADIHQNEVFEPRRDGFGVALTLFFYYYQPRAFEP